MVSCCSAASSFFPREEALGSVDLAEKMALRVEVLVLGDLTDQEDGDGIVGVYREEAVGEVVVDVDRVRDDLRDDARVVVVFRVFSVNSEFVFLSEFSVCVFVVYYFFCRVLVVEVFQQSLVLLLLSPAL